VKVEGLSIEYVTMAEDEFACRDQVVVVSQCEDEDQREDGRGLVKISSCTRLFVLSAFGMLRCGSVDW
jgi:hypothetical protein